MKKTRTMWVSIICVIIMALALADAKTITCGAESGIKMCLEVVLPSLFPFIFMCILFSGYISQLPFPFSSAIERSCGIPKGSLYLLILGLLGGYPVGAQCIASAYNQGQLQKADAERMLPFCNNAGPGFIFGLMGVILKDGKLCLYLWLIQIVSAIIVGGILPSKSKSTFKAVPRIRPTIPASLEKSVSAMAKICGWIILFRVLIEVINTHFHFLSNIFVYGILELSNGCLQLQHTAGVSAAFILAAPMLAFGGLCVFLQTKSVASGLSARYYFPGKALQTIISFVLALAVSKFTVAF